jgi:hypothetical protein
MMRKIAMLVTAVGVFFAGAVTTAHANSYAVTQSGVLPTKAGTPANPKPVSILFGYGVTPDTPGTRPSVTTDYVIAFGRQIRQNRALFTSRNAIGRASTRTCSNAQAGLDTGQPPACPAGSIAGRGVVKNQAGLVGSTGVAANCNLGLQIAVGTGRVSTQFNNDGKRVKSDLLLLLKGGPSGVPGRPEVGTCPLAVDAALPAAFVSAGARGTALSFHVPVTPFQQPQSGIENAVVDVTSTVSKTVRVRTRVRRGGRTVTVIRRRGLFESTGCRGRAHSVNVAFTDKSGQTFNANKAAPCRP